MQHNVMRRCRVQCGGTVGLFSNKLQVKGTTGKSTQVPHCTLYYSVITVAYSLLYVIACV